MRTREEINDEFNMSWEAGRARAQLEVLLDIRDFLTKDNTDAK